MVRLDLESFIREMGAFFERPKPPAQATIDLWAKEVADIPPAAIPYIMTAVKKLDLPPRNLPGFMRSQYHNWLKDTGQAAQAHSIHDRRIHPERWALDACSTCKGKGTYPLEIRWPMYRDEEGNIVWKKKTVPCLCHCTDKWGEGG
jgi:hypothetical protein